MSSNTKKHALISRRRLVLAGARGLGTGRLMAGSSDARGRRVGVWIALALVALIAAGVGAEAALAAADERILFVSTRDSGEIYSVAPEGSALVRVTQRDPSGFVPAWSPDGSRIAFTGSADDQSRQLWLMSRTGGGPHRLTNLRVHGLDGGPGFDPDWSPSGRRLVFSLGGHAIYTVRTNGTQLRRLTGRGRVGHDDWDPAWSPKGGAILFTRDGRIHRMRPDGTHLRRLGLGDEADWSPNGKRIVFSVWQRNGWRDLYMMNADGSNRRRLTRTRADESRPAWSPGGGTIAFTRGGALWLMRRDGSDAHRVVGNAWAPAWAPGGRLLAFSRRKTVEVLENPEDATAIFTVRRDGSGVRPILTPEFDRNVASSPDGTRLAITSVRPFSRSGVYVADAGGGNETFLHRGGSPAWSPDGLKVILRDADGLYVVAADGSSATKLPAPAGARNPAWRPDGSAVSFVAEAGGCSDVYTMALDGSDLTRVTAAACYPAPREFAWTPDGTRIVFSGPGCDYFDGCETEQIFSATVPGGTPTALTGLSSSRSDEHPAVSPDGTKIAFQRWDFGGLGSSDIWVMNSDGSGKASLPTGGVGHRPSWLP